jgi:hypothetical protein
MITTERSLIFQWNSQPPLFHIDHYSKELHLSVQLSTLLFSNDHNSMELNLLVEFLTASVLQWSEQ